MASIVADIQASTLSGILWHSSRLGQSVEDNYRYRMSQTLSHIRLMLDNLPIHKE